MPPTRPPETCCGGIRNRDVQVSTNVGAKAELDYSASWSNCTASLCRDADPRDPMDIDLRPLCLEATDFARAIMDDVIRPQSPAPCPCGSPPTRPRSPGLSNDVQ